jgi:hypothetical protein
VAAERRTEEDIRREIASEREQLAVALGDLRQGVKAKKRVASVVAGALAAGLMAVAVSKLARRVRT